MKVMQQCRTNVGSSAEMFPKKVPNMPGTKCLSLYSTPLSPHRFQHAYTACSHIMEVGKSTSFGPTGALNCAPA